MAQGVLEAHGGVAQTPGAGSQDKGLFQCQFKGFTGDLGDKTGQRNGQCHRRQYQGAPAIATGRGEPAQAEGEHRQQQNTQPEVRQGSGQGFGQRGQAGHPAATAGGEHGQRQDQQPGQRQSTEGKLQGRPGLLGEHLRDR